MYNSSEVTSFILAAYGDIGGWKYVYFTLTLLWYACICASNLSLVAVIVGDRRLHEPMYMLLCNLSANELSSSTSLYPVLLSQMLSRTHEVPLPLCFLQMFHFYTSASVEFGTLAAMAYDRYVAICHPLYYNVMVTRGKAVVGIVLIWSYSMAHVMLMVFVVIRVRLCGNVIDKVFCDHHMVVKLACAASPINKMSDILFGCVTIGIPFSLIAVSYLRILAVCLNAAAENRRKALATCAPQIVSVSNLFVGCAFHVADSRLDKSRVSSGARVLLSVYLLVCQPLVTPFMYGFSLPKIRRSCGRLLFSKPKIVSKCGALNEHKTHNKHAY